MFPSDNKAIVSEINRVKKSKTWQQSGRIIDKEMPIHISNLSFYVLVKKPAKIGYKLNNDKKIRISKLSGKEI